ncbi:hypothetical protein KHA80_02305 [Anaerobacillus sp. HL2]|nr:hypothetical protein KHA80_02305 [Anaerobacillus sp. HL2]
MKVTIIARSCPFGAKKKSEGNDHGKIVPFDAKKRMKVTITADRALQCEEKKG